MEQTIYEPRRMLVTYAVADDGTKQTAVVDSSSVLWPIIRDHFPHTPLEDAADSE